MTVTANKQGVEAFNDAYTDVFEYIVASNYGDAYSALLRLRSLQKDVNDCLKESVAHASNALKDEMKNTVILITDDGQFEGAWKHDPNSDKYELTFRVDTRPKVVYGAAYLPDRNEVERINDES